MEKSYEQETDYSGGTRSCVKHEQRGDGSGDNYAVTVANPVDDQNYVHTVYGRISLIGKRGTPVGTYTDTIGIIVNY
jgi:spore coat protein U-like protein